MPLLRILLICLTCSIIAFSQTAKEPLQFTARIGFTGKDDRIYAQKYFDADRKVLLIGKKTIQIWDVPAAKLLDERPHEIPNLEKFDTTAVISPDARKAIVLDSLSFRIIRKEKKVAAPVYDLQTGKLITILERPTESVRDAVWSEDGKTLVTYSGTFNNKRTEICFWDGEDLSFRAAIMLKGDFRLPYLSRDGKWLVTSVEKYDEGIFGTVYGSEKSTTVWNTENGKVLQNIKLSNGESPRIFSLIRDKISPNEKYFVAQSEDKISVWKIGGSSLPKYEIPAAKKGGFISYDGFSGDGRYLIAYQNKTVEFYDAEIGKFEFSISKVRSFTGATLQKDGSTLILESCERAEGYDLPSRQKLYEIKLVCKSQFDPVSTDYRDFDILQFHPNGQLLLTYSDKTVRVWNARNGTLLQTLADLNRIENKKKDNNKDDGLGWSAGWLMNGDYLYAAGADGKSILLWQTDKNFKP